MHNGDGSRPRIRPAVSNRFDNSSYYEYLERQTAHSDPQAQPAQQSQVIQPSQNSAQQPSPQNLQHNQPHGQPAPVTPPQAPRKSKSFMWLSAIAAIAVVALLVTVGIVLLGPNKGVEPTPPQRGSATKPDDAPNSQDEPGSANEQAKSELETIVSDSESELSELEEKWVVQLSAKQPSDNASDQEEEWDYSKILKEYRDNEKTYGTLAMLKSEDWSSFRVNDYWVTVIPTGYNSPEPALKKCEEFKLDRDNCFAKRLSHTKGPDGSTKLRE
ncbi:hypothetical protein QP572_08560 [Brevibacterium sp. UMB10442]|nr:hypothetical protein [Brevibacterium sp. UMB10442]